MLSRTRSTPMASIGSLVSVRPATLARDVRARGRRKGAAGRSAGGGRPRAALYASSSSGDESDGDSSEEAPRKSKKRRAKKEPKKSAKRPKSKGAATDLCKLWAKHQTEDGAPRCRYGKECRFRHKWADKKERARFERDN